MNPMRGVEVVMISQGLRAPYSGMLPARLAGWYRDEEMHFDLANLCAQSGVIFLDDEVLAVDAGARRVILRERPALNYDVASINVGITPVLPEGAEGHPHVLAVKPIARLLPKWEELWAHPVRSEAPWVIVGGGAAGFELAMIVSLRFRQLGLKQEVLLVQSGELLSGHGQSVAAHGLRLLKQAGVKLHFGFSVQTVKGQELIGAAGERIVFSEAILTTGARAPEWLRSSGLPVSSAGFVCIDRFLQVSSHLFAAGDCAAFAPGELPKSGVFAVREGPVLCDNLRRSLRGEKLRTYRPRRKVLALLTSGERRALMSFHGWHVEGAWVWRWKDYVDREFMRVFGAEDVEPMVSELNTCGGCGGKIGASDLRALLTSLGENGQFRALLPAGIEDVGQAGGLVSSIDGFRSFCDDDFFFGQVATWHALNDFFASGTLPSGINVFAGLPEAASKVRQDHLHHLMAGVLKVLGELQVPLLNAHSAEAADTTLVLTPVGEERGPWHKNGLRAGDVLILSKALGVGCLLQAQMAGALPAAARDSLYSALRQHHAVLVQRLREFSIGGCTDISGFGLAGHAYEMAEASRVHIELQVETLPLLVGFSDLSRLGYKSALAVDNEASFFDRVDGPYRTRPELWDPQTHGPLLFSVPAAQSELALTALRECGFTQAALVGRVISGAPGVSCVDADALRIFDR